MLDILIKRLPNMPAVIYLQKNSVVLNESQNDKLKAVR